MGGLCCCCANQGESGGGDADEPLVPSEITVEKKPKQQLGLQFADRGSRNLVVEAARGEVSNKYNLQRFEGRLLTHVNGAQVTTLEDMKPFRHLRRLVLRFTEDFDDGKPLGTFLQKQYQPPLPPLAPRVATWEAPLPVIGTPTTEDVKVFYYNWKAGGGVVEELLVHGEAAGCRAEDDPVAAQLQPLEAAAVCLAARGAIKLSDRRWEQTAMLLQALACTIPIPSSFPQPAVLQTKYTPEASAAAAAVWRRAEGRTVHWREPVAAELLPGDEGPGERWNVDDPSGAFVVTVLHPRQFLPLLCYGGEVPVALLPAFLPLRVVQVAPTSALVEPDTSYPPVVPPDHIRRDAAAQELPLERVAFSQPSVANPLFPSTPIATITIPSSPASETGGDITR